MAEQWTIRTALAWTERYLERAGDEHPRQSAEWLLAWACDLPRLELYLDRDRPLTIAERGAYREAIRRRAAGEPLQYITGTTAFRYLNLAVAPDVLIPRPETEVLVSEFLRLLPAASATPLLVADIGAGSGNIACSLASERPDCSVMAFDKAPAALALARANVERLGLTDRVTVIEGDVTTGLDELAARSLDGLISNPPYVPSDVVETLPREVAAFEPRVALDGGDDGLAVFRHLVTVASRTLKPAGVFAVELFEDTLTEAAALAEAAGFAAVSVHRDLTDRPRVLTAIQADG